MPEGFARTFSLTLGVGVNVSMASIFQAPIIDVGDGTRINGEINIRGANPCVIGKYCAIGHSVTLITSDHDYRKANLQLDLAQKIGGFDDSVIGEGRLTIGNNVWIGDNVTILKDVSIGNGAVIGAGSIVSKDIAPFSVNVGNPCKQIRQRFSDEVIACLEEICWWDWSIEKMREHQAFFRLDLSESSLTQIRTLLADSTL